MSIIESCTCIEYVAQGCQDITEAWNWGWNADNFLRDRPGESISSADWTVPPELIEVQPPTTTASVTYVLIENDTGLVDDTYQLLADVTFTGGDRIRLRIDVTLIDKTLEE